VAVEAPGCQPVGVPTATGERLRSDLVIDMSGRCSGLPRWREAIGARPPAPPRRVGAGREVAPHRAEVSRALVAAAGSDPDCLQAYLALASFLERGVDVLKRPGLIDKVLQVGGNWRERPLSHQGRAPLDRRRLGWP
jgi:hypothetical protein